MTEIFETMRDALTGTFKVPAEDITPQASLGQLDLDSLALAEFALELQERLAVPVEDGQVTAHTTLAELEALIRTRLPGTAAP